MSKTAACAESAPLVIAHRGASGYRPEHTASAYRLALQQGAPAVEPDIVVSRDGVLVVRHENEISGTTDVAQHPEFADRYRTKFIDGQRVRGWFTEDFSWEELATLRSRERIPKTRPANTLFDGAEGMLRLVDVLAILDESVVVGDGPVQRRLPRVVIELKHSQYFLEQGFDLAELVLRDLASAGWLDCPERITFESFEPGVLDRLQRSEAPGARILLTETQGLPGDAAAHMSGNARPWEWYRTDEGLRSLHGRVSGISVAKVDLFQRPQHRSRPGRNDLVTRAHAGGLLVYVWTLRPENRFLLPAFRSSGTLSEPGNWKAEWSEIIAAGVDGVFVDHPDLMHQLR